MALSKKIEYNMDEHNTLTSSPEHINMKWGRKWNSIYLKIQDFVSQVHSELIAWYVHTHSEGNLFLGYNIKATRRREVIRPHLWVWTTHFSRIRDKVKKLNSQESTQGDIRQEKSWKNWECDT